MSIENILAKKRWSQEDKDTITLHISRLESQLDEAVLEEDHLSYVLGPLTDKYVKALERILELPPHADIREAQDIARGTLWP